MTRYLNKSLCPGLWVICALFCSPSFAEGTKQLSPILNGDTSFVMLNTNLVASSNFAAYDGPIVSRLNIRIQANDTVYIGFSQEYNDFGDPDGTGRFCFRIKDSGGTVVHGPFEIDASTANADSWLLATSGPDVLGDPNGYDTSPGFARFIPASTGDYYIEFSDNPDCTAAAPNTIVNIKFFDITVKNIVEKPGRLWSRNWGLISPPLNGMSFTPPECQFDRSFNGTLFSYTTDGFVSKIDFDSSGFQGLNFTVAFGERGPRNTGDVLIDRMSVNMADSTANAADHMVFINEPDETEFPSSNDICGEIELFSVQCVADTFCFNVGITQPGQIEIILDFSGDGQFTMDTNDVIIAVILEIADTVCLGWNGLKGDGSPLTPGEPIPTIIRYSQGVQHYAAYDVEFLKFGFCVETIRPICPGVQTDLLYWDDSNIADNLATPFDESDPGTGQPLVELNGCTCQTGGCRTWTNAHVDADTTCTGTSSGYGDLSTLNTWWFATTMVVGPLNLVSVGAEIVGDTAICTGDSTELIAMGTPDTLDFIYEWMGPNGFMAMTQSTGQIADPGTYYVTITDTVSNCSAVDSAILVVFDAPQTSITFMCIPNQPNANVDLTVMGNGPFMYMWSNAVMMEDLMNVPPGTYYVTVTDVNTCQAIDSVTVEECCVFDIECPPMNGGQFSCLDSIPAQDSTAVIVNDFCEPLMIDIMDEEISEEATGCIGDTIFIQRTYTVTDGGGGSSVCVQIFSVVDDVPPMITCPPNDTVDCNTPFDPQVTGTPTISDNCTAEGDLMLTFVDSGNPGVCGDDPPIIRTWTVTDACGLTASCVQLITVGDALPPQVTMASCPADITVDCDDADFEFIPPTYSDNCTDNQDIQVTSRLDSLGFDGTCMDDVIGIISITFFAEDLCGNVDSSCVFIVTVQDTTGPTFTVPQDVTIDCEQDPTDLQLTGDVTDEEDNCTTASVEFMDDNSGLSGCNETGIIIRTWTATDACGNETTQQQEIAVQDTTPPTAVCMDVTIDFGLADEIILSPDTVDAGSSDNCGDVTLMLSDSVFACTEFLEQSTVVIQLIVTDECGLADTCDAMVTGIGGGGLQIECPNDIVVNLGSGQCEAIVNYVVTASSLCGGPSEEITIEQVDDSGLTSGDFFPIGVTLQEYIAYNDSGDTVSCSFTITVIEGPEDPFLTCNDTVRISLDAQCQAIINPDIILEGGTFGCFDDFYICVLGIGCDSGEIVITNPDLGCYTVTITNAAGNTCWGIACFEDKLPPMITCEDVTVDCTESTDPELFEPIASDACGEVTLDYTEQQTGELCENIIITRTWTATDESGNTAQCVQTITVTPLTLDGLEFPDNYQGICGESSHPDNTGWPTLNDVEIEDFLCNIFLTWWDHPLSDCGGGIKIIRTWTVLDWCTLELVEGTQIIKLTDEQGPELDCPDEIVEGTDPWFCHTDVDIWIDAIDICESYPLTYTVSINGGATINLGINPHYKIIDLPLGSHTATWTVTDACGNKSTCTSIIIVEDDIEPVAVCDEHTILSLIFEDLLDEGLTKLHATSLDDGSYDNCSEELIFLARRMPPPLPHPFEPSCIDFDWISNSEPYMEFPNNDGGPPEAIDLGYTFQPWVPFACCDVGKTVLVEFMVTDEAGNTNTCMVEVEVQDKLKPIIECPPDITVGCEFWFDAHETNGFVPADGLEHVFGRVVDDEDDRQPIIINDPSPGSPFYLQDHLWGYDGWADDNCDVTITVDTDIDDDCSGETLPGNAPNNAVRLIRRTFRATDGSGNRETCTQRIWVVDYDPFEIYDEICGLWPGGDDVRWPCDLELTDCPEDTSPEGLSAYAPNNAPLVRDDNCSIIGVTYDDQVFYFIDGACFKIVRTWTIIDWCQFESDGHGGFEGYWQYVQVIKVNDHQGAEFLDCPSEPVTLCIEDEGVTLPSNNQVFLGESNQNSSACSAHVLLTHEVFEGCSDEVIYDVKFYPFNGSGFVQVHAKTNVPVDDNNHAILTFNTQQNSLPSSHMIRRYGLPYNDKYCSNYPAPGGTKDYHRILWTVEDGCGNITTCSYLLRIEDCKKPTPICVGLTSVVMPNSGSVTIWAADFDSGSSVDDCTAHENLLFSFSGETYKPGKEFNCDIIDDNGSPTFIVEIWVADEGNDQNCDGTISWNERNKDYCTTFITIDDNEDVCPGGVGVAGTIQTHSLEPVELVHVDMMDPGAQVMNTYITDKDGYYRFTNPLIDYVVHPKRNDNHKNGVSTLDLVEIQKHLLGIQQLSSPYKMIAADANNSESVSALDLVEIRKLILGLYVEFPNNESWRFVDAGFEFDNPVSPWPFAEQIVIDNGMTGHEDFIAVKIGDVNGTVHANAGQIQTRGARKVLLLEVEDRDVQHGDIIDIPVTAHNFNSILGFQFTMETGGLEFSGVTSGALTIPAGFVAEHANAITMSWLDLGTSDLGTSDLGTSVGLTSVRPEQTLFTLRFKANQTGKLSNLLQITSAITEAEAYTDLGASTGPTSVANGNIALLDIALTFGKTLHPAGLDFALYQNEPNPFSDQTVIGFDLPVAMPASLTVYDVHGRIVRKIEGNYGQGYNEITLSAKELKVAGAYYYHLNAGDFTASKRLLLTRE